MSLVWNQIEPTNEIDKIFYETSTHKIRLGYGEFGKRKTVIPIHYAQIAERCENFQVKDSDIFVSSYPKTGTTWCQEMVWMIVSNLDFNGGKVLLHERFPFLEFSGLYDYKEAVKINPEFKVQPMMEDSIKCVETLRGDVRFVKTHLPWGLLPKQIRNKEKKPKIIYISRTAKDTCVSYFYHCILKEGFKGDFRTFCKLFLVGKVTFGNYWDHILSYWERKDDPNLLFIRFEDMKQDLPSVVKTVASFLNKTLTDIQIEILCKHLSFESMKLNPALNYCNIPNRQFFDNNAEGISFLRSGKVGSYKEDMDEEMEKVFDKWIQENVDRTGIQI